MEGEKPYQPTPEDIRKAEDTMTPEQKKMSEEKEESYIGGSLSETRGKIMEKMDEIKERNPYFAGVLKEMAGLIKESKNGEQKVEWMWNVSSLSKEFPVGSLVAMAEKAGNEIFKGLGIVKVEERKADRSTKEQPDAHMIILHIDFTPNVER